MIRFARMCAPRARRLGTILLACGLLAGAGATPAGLAQAVAPASAPSQGAAQAPGAPFTAAQVSAMLPQSVWFAGKTAPLQLRNASGTTFANGTIFWAGLVDTSGYSTSVQDRYQFYFVVEGPVRLGDVEVKAGAYGGGFVGDRFTLMDLGDHTVAQGPIQTDADLRRPRPLQIVAEHPDAVKLYLGRKWVTVQTSSH